MYYGTVLGLVFLHVALLLAINAYWLLGRALLPALADSSGARILDRPVRTTLAGIALLLPAAILGIALLNAPNGVVKLLGSAILFGLVVSGLAGSAGLVERIGGRLSPSESLSPLARMLRGGAALSFAFVFPFVGWFLLVPTLAAGLGGALHHAFRRRPPAAPPASSANASVSVVASSSSLPESNSSAADTIP